MLDRTFNADKARAKEIFRDIAEKGGNTGFHFEIAADLLDDETAEILSRAKKGLIQLEIGVRSSHPPTLRAIRREQDFSHTRRMVRRIAEGGNVHQHLDLIAGLPLEGLGEFAKSFDDVMDVGAEKVQLGFLKVLHGSAMEAEAARYGIEYQKSAPYEVTRTDAIAPAELALLHEIEYLLNRAYNSGLFPQTVRWFSRQCGGYFAFFREWNDLAKEGKPPRNWTGGAPGGIASRLRREAKYSLWAGFSSLGRSLSKLPPPPARIFGTAPEGSRAARILSGFPGGMGAGKPKGEAPLALYPSGMVFGGHSRISAGRKAAGERDNRSL